MTNNNEITRAHSILRRLEGKKIGGQSRRLPGWVAMALLGAGLTLTACDSKEPCEEDCNNIYNNVNNLYGNVNNYNNAYDNSNNYNNPLYGIQDAGTDDLDSKVNDASEDTPDVPRGKN